MSQSGNDVHYYPSSSCAYERYTCSSPFALESFVADASEVDFEDVCQDAKESSQADFKVALSFEDGRTGAQEPTKVELDFEDGRKCNLSEVATKFLDGTLFEKEMKNKVCGAEAGEVSGTETNADLEEGEIQDTQNAISLDEYSCRYYQKGFCAYGKDCRFFHVSDKGLYNMFDLPVAVKNYVRCSSQFVTEKKYIPIPPIFEDKKTSWDHDLKEAMERINESNKKVPSGREKLRMAIQSINSDDKFTIKQSPPRSSHSHSLARKGRKFSCNTKETMYKVATTKPKSWARDCIDVPYSLNRLRTPSDMRWSPKSVSFSSQSRSRSRSSCRCSFTPSPKRCRPVLSSRVTSSYRKRCVSSSSKSSASSVSMNGSRRGKCRRRKGRFRSKSPKISDRRSAVKNLLPGRQERESSRLSRRDVPCRTKPNLRVTNTSTSLCPITSNRNCSDMSISPLWDLSNDKDDHPECSIVCNSSDRCVSDMSISPFSSNSSSSYRFPGEGIDSSMLKSNSMKSCEDFVQAKSANDRELTKSGPRKTSRKQSLCHSNSVSNPAKKSDPLLIDLMKFRGCFKRDDSLKGTKHVPSKTPVTTTVSKSVDRSTELNAIEKEEQKTKGTQSKLSKKEILLKRLHEINTASNSVSNPAKKSDPLLIDLMKFHGCFKKDHSLKGTKHVPSKTPGTTTVSKPVDRSIELNAIEKEEQKTKGTQSNLSKKEILLKRLHEINTAIEKKKILRNAL